jgi:uncharacterized protein
MILFEELLKVLACPRCKEPLSLDGVESASPGSGILSCVGCALAYPIRDGVPELLSGEARPSLKSGH